MEKTKNIIAIIPARGGSKRIPKKNIKLFAGKPLIAWTIEEAKRSHLLDRIIVSTDSKEIARVAREYGAEVPFMRPRELAGDKTPDLPVFEHALRWLAEHGEPAEIIVHLRCNVPFRTAEDINKGITLLRAHKKYDSVRAVIPAPLHPLKTYRFEGERLFPFIPEKVFKIKEPYNTPVQSLPMAYASAGYLSVIRADTILKKHSMTGTQILGFVVSAKNAIDIDTPEEFEFAEMMMKK